MRKIISFIDLYKKILNTINSNESRRRVSNALIFGVGGAIGSRVLLMLTTLVVARVLSEELYGQYSLVNSTVQLFVLFAGMGIGATLNRYTALYYKKDKEKAGQIIASLYMICALLSFALSIAMFIMAQTISLWVADSTELTGYFRITSGTIFFTALASLQQSILQGMEKFKKNAQIQVFTCILLLVLSFILVLLLGLEGSMLALLLTQGVNFILFRRAVKKQLKKHSIYLKVLFNSEIREIICHFALPSFVSSIFVLPVTWLNNSLLAKNSGFAELAIFSIALQWFTILTYLPNQLYQVRPIYTDYYANNRKVELRNILSKITLYSTVFVAIVAVGTVTLGRSILQLYGDAYVDSYSVFAVMVLTSVVVASQSQVGVMIQASGKMWWGFILNAIWASILFISFYFMREWGALGYAIAYFISYVAHTINSFIVLFLLLKGMRSGGACFTTSKYGGFEEI